jgi:nucleoside 2-deoxyribosyltransferase
VSLNKALNKLVPKEPTKAYLAHPHTFKDEAKAKIQPVLESLGIKVNNPFERKQQPEIDKARENKTFHEYWAKKIVQFDMDLIRNSDFIVAYVPTYAIIGTAMEIGISGYTHLRPVYVIWGTDDYVIKTHPWINHFATKTFDNVEEFASWYKENHP